MPRYRITFYGCPIGRLNAAAKDRVQREVEAPDAAAAAMMAYDTHEHILGAVDGVDVAAISPAAPPYFDRFMRGNSDGNDPEETD